MGDDKLVFYAITRGLEDTQPFDQPGKLKMDGSGCAGTRYSLAEDVPHEAWTTSERKNPDLLLVPGRGIVANDAPLHALRAIGILGKGNSLLTPVSWKNYYTGMGIRNRPIRGKGVYATGYAQGGMGYSSDDPDDVTNPLAQSVIQKVMMDRFMENPVLRNLANGYDTDLDSDDGKPVSGTPIADIARAIRSERVRGQWTWHDLIRLLRQAAKEFELAYDAGDIDYNPLLESGAVDADALDVLTARGVAGLSNKVVVPGDEDFELLRKRLIEERKAAGRSYNGKKEDIVRDYMFDKLVDYLWHTAVLMEAFSFGSKPSNKYKERADRVAKRFAGGTLEVVQLAVKASDIVTVNDMLAGKQGSALEHMNQKLIKSGVLVDDHGWSAMDLKKRCKEYFVLRNDWNSGRISGKDAFWEAFKVDPERIP